MIRDFLGRLLVDIGTRILDEQIPVEILQSFLTTGLDRAADKVRIDPTSIPAESVAEIILANKLLERTPLQLNSQMNEQQKHVQDLYDIDQITNWIEQLPKNKIVSRDGLIQGSGDVLLWINDHYPPQLQEFFAANLERTLRHIEVKRKEALRVIQAAPSSDIWMERHAVSIVFCRYSRKFGDRRYLNTALKLNDWAYPSHRKLGICPRFIRYLLALAEAEASVQEMTI